MKKVSLLTLFVFSMCFNGQNIHKDQNDSTENVQDNPIKVVVQAGHLYAVTTVAFDPQGSTVLSGGVMAKLWDVKTGKLIRNFDCGETNIFITNVSYSPGGHYVLISNSKGVSRLLEKTTGKLIQTYGLNYGSAVVRACINSDSTKIIAVYKNGVSRSYNIKTAACLKQQQLHKREVWSMAFSVDFRLMMTGCCDNTARAWVTRNFKCDQIFAGQSGRINAVDFSPVNKNLVITCSQDGTIVLWNRPSSEKILTIGEPGDTPILAAKFTKSGKYIITGDQEGLIKIFSATTGNLEREYKFHDKSIMGIDISSNSRYFISGSADKKAVIWDINTGKPFHVLTGEVSYVNDVAMSEDCHFVLTGSEDGYYRKWDLKTGKQICSGKHGTERITQVAFSKGTGKYYATAGTDGKIVIYHAESDSLIQTLNHGGNIYSVDFAPNNQFLTSSSNDGTINIWRIETGILVKILTPESATAGNRNICMSVNYNNVGDRIIAAYRRGNVINWDVRTGNVTGRYDNYDKSTDQNVPIYCSVISPDNSRILVADARGYVSLLDSHNLSPIYRREINKGDIYSLAFSPDSRYFVVTCKDNSIRVCRTETGAEVKKIKDHSGLIQSILYSSDGRYIVSGSRDYTTRFWDATTYEHVATLISADRQKWISLGPNDLFDASLEGKELIHLAKGNSILDLGIFEDRFFSPNILARVVQREPIDMTSFSSTYSNSPPPEVSIITPAMNDTIQSDRVKVVVQVKIINDQLDGRCLLFHNGKRVGGIFRGIRIVQTDVVYDTFEVDLLSGTNTIHAVAHNKNRLSGRDEITVYREAPVPQSTLYICAIAINEYIESSYNLNYCISDAEGILRTFRKTGHSLYKDIHVDSLYNSAATQSSIYSMLDTIIEKARPEDVFVFFYSGHGVQNGNSFYFVTSNTTNMHDQLMLQDRSVSDDTLNEKLQKIRARKQLVMLDACHSGHAVGVISKGSTQEEALYKMNRSSGVYILAAALHDQFANEYEELGHGIFTYTILQGLSDNFGADSDNNHLISANELVLFVESNMPKYSRLYSRSVQIPTKFTTGTDFPIALLR
ncbi:MAG: caspase family protein [Nanoarchaeota archaeon]|nr:caspase family protein [Nanoarchaeota archaeon]